MTRIIRRMMMIACMFILFSIPVNAEEDQMASDPVDGFLASFDMSTDDLFYTDYSKLINNFEDYYYTSSKKDLNQFGSFSFSGGLDYKKFSTFSDEKVLVGYGEEATLVGLMVYKKVDDELVYIDSSLKTLGASGLYSKRISFECEQVQYLVVAVKVEGIVQSRVYQITTKKEATKAYLENIEIDFLPNELPRAAVPEFEVPALTDIEF